MLEPATGDRWPWQNHSVPGLFLLPGGWVRPGAEHGEQKAYTSTTVFLRRAPRPAAGALDEHELRGILYGRKRLQELWPREDRKGTGGR